MYSPRISEDLVPVLYRTAKARSVPMTSLVDRLLYQALAVDPLPLDAFALYRPSKIVAASPLPKEAIFAEGRSEELGNIFRSFRANGFRDGREIEAWYAGTIHGLCRVLQNQLYGGDPDPSQDPNLVALFRSVCGVRAKAHELLPTDTNRPWHRDVLSPFYHGSESTEKR